MADDQVRGPAPGALGWWTPQCLSALELALLTSTAGPETGRLLDHVATCEYCAAQLKLLVEMKLAKSPPKPQWRDWAVAAATQLKLLVEMKLAKCAHKPRWRDWAVAAGVAIAVGSGVLGLYLEDPARKSSRLLAEAYSAHRTFEWRLRDAGWSQQRTQLGAVTERPAPLLDAEALLARKADRENDPKWLGLRARADMLDFRFESAIALLQRAVQASPNSTDLLTDLAVAYGLNADKLSRPAELAAAVEFSTRALAIDPQNRRAMFNRAIAFERLYMVDRAIKDWEQYLKIETDPAWMKEGRTHLGRLRATQEKRSRLMESDEQSGAVPERKAVEFKNDRAKAWRITLSRECFGRAIPASSNDTARPS